MNCKPFRILLMAWLSLLAMSCVDAGAVSQQRRAAATDVVYTAKDSSTIVKLLEEARKMPGKTNLELFFAKQFVGMPYVAHTLEVSDNGEPLVVNTRQMDCTTFVETVAALTICAQRHLYSMKDFRAALTSLRYRNGIRQGYVSRLHYFSDWISDNCRMGLVEEIVPDASRIATRSQKLSLNYMSTHPKAYKALKLHPELVNIIRQQEQRLNSLKPCLYVPKDVVDTSQKALRAMVHDGDIIAITCNKAGLDIAHLGFAVWKADGLHLLNASQLHKKVIVEPMTLGKYLGQHPSHTGIRVVRIRK